MIREAKFSNTSSSLSLATFSLDETGVSSVSHGKGASQSSRTSKEGCLWPLGCSCASSASERSESDDSPGGVICASVRGSARNFKGRFGIRFSDLF